jgi:hypothetical protein
MRASVGSRLAKFWQSLGDAGVLVVILMSLLGLFFDLASVSMATQTKVATRSVGHSSVAAGVLLVD